MNTQSLLTGLTVVIIFIPFSTKALQNNNINLNGLVLDFAEVVLETVTRRDVNFGDENRIDRSWENPAP
ncbi:hypothetical protein C7293_13810 [filamentous cyanobacterium CCT1]|nr:hypothetical protein C7293_13810 [filamentous cyanobacterium CCT1]PSN80398.1 hypothetical protein C8B47_06740 [filamentous cyanobacterium CCP4]